MLFVFRSSLLNTYNLMLTYNYLLSHYISYFKLFILTLNYIFSLNIVEAIDYKISINFRSADSISFENMIRQLYFKALFFFARFKKILRFPRNEQKPTGHVYCRGADHASLTNHALLSVQFTAHHVLILALIR